MNALKTLGLAALTALLISIYLIVNSANQYAEAKLKKENAALRDTIKQLRK